MRRAFTWLLVGAAILGMSIGASFGAGTVYGRSTAKAAPAPQASAANPQAQSSQAAEGTPGGRGQFSGGQGGAQSGQGARPGANTVTGMVRSLDEKTLKVAVAGGSETTVNLADTTRFATTTVADRSAVLAGMPVVIAGQRGQDGNLTASFVLVLPPGFLVDGQ